MKYKNENMDCLNDRLKKKDLGAFYTPKPYCKKAAELVKMAVDRVPDGNDYIILDRCAGTGNLEEALEGIYDKNGSELISHCIVSTYEYYEYRVLFERLLGKVREIIPPSEENVIYSNGMVSNADAMSKEFIDNPIIKQYLDNPKCNVILFENPPFRDKTSGLEHGEAIRTGKRVSYVLDEMKKEVKGVATNEIAHMFIWSAFKFYIRNSHDSYIVFAPAKYWKQYNFVCKKPIKCFIFNRKHFHASSSSITCIFWGNSNSGVSSIYCEVFDIDPDNSLQKIDLDIPIVIKKVFKPASKNYNKIRFSSDDIINIHCAKNGQEYKGDCKVKSYWNNKIIGYLEADSFQISPKVQNIVSLCLYNGHGCYLTRDRYKEILPIWVAKNVPLDNWYEKDIYATTSDGGDKYTKDKEFLKNCLIYTCLSNQNKCLSFIGSDGRYYKNNLCFDNDTIASNELKHTKLDLDEKELINLWDKIINEARKTENYNDSYTYGIYQINKELNTFDISGIGKGKQRIYDYPELNGLLNILKIKLKKYYKSHITDKMFKYELLK